MLVISNRSKIEALIAILVFGMLVAIRKFLFSSLETSGVWELVAFSVLFLGVMPALVIALIFRSQVRGYYLNWSASEKTGWGILLMVLMLAAFILCVLKLDWTNICPVFLWVRGGWGLTLFIDVLLLSLVVISTEFFFRGFFLKTTATAWGTGSGVILATLACTGYSALSLDTWQLPHIAFLATLNLLLTLLACLTRTIWLSVLTHWMILLAIDLLTVYKFFPLGI